MAQVASIRAKKDAEIDVWITNHEKAGMTSTSLYFMLLEERIRRSQLKLALSLETSLAHLMVAAVEQRCTTYGALAEASGVEWSKARHQMNGANGHLDRLMEMCHIKELPMLPAICVNQNGLVNCELEDAALAGFVTGAQRLGMRVVDPRTFHHQCRDHCWEWGRTQTPN